MQADARPASAVSTGVGVAGLAGLALWAAIGLRLGMNGPYAAIVAVLSCGVPMVAWSLLVDKVHRAPSTGLDWSRPLAPWRDTLDVSLVKLAGLWATWGVVAFLYAACRWYWDGQYVFAMHLLIALLPWLVAASIPYMLWIDRRLAEPRDGCHAVGLLLLGRRAEADRALLAEHARTWAVKGFFTAFMISIVPGNWAALIDLARGGFPAGPVALGNWLIALMFLIDVAFATVGYLLTLRPLDAHIRSANPHAAAWTAALICYPPFALMNRGGPLDYHTGAQDWTVWLAGWPVASALLTVPLVLLTAGYAWATIAFGPRFSNLTHRGILTHGPYAISKHPAYLAKNLYWWCSAMPFLTTTGLLSDRVRNTLVLAAVSGVYYWRARTEERHLSADPAYRDYAAWMARHGPVPRLFAWVRDRARGAAPQPAG